MGPSDIERWLDRNLLSVQKPGRYTGGELNQQVKDWAKVPFRVALAFPEIYELGMSNLGLTILYEILNRQTEVLAERVYSPWTDMELAMRAARVPLYSLETKHPVSEFDLLAISLPYESLFTNALNLLDLSGIPLLVSDRVEGDPVVIAGGHSTYNPEPMADFIDAFVIGEGEDVILEMVEVIRSWRAEGVGRDPLHRRLAKIWGVYVPSLYRPHYAENGTLDHIEALAPEASLPVIKRIVSKLPEPVTNFIVPMIDITHNRIPIEIMRGCTRGCRFCQAGMITRPVRERPVEEVVGAIEAALDATGFEEVGLLSLSSSDYDEILALVRAVSDRFRDRRLNIGLPSLRIESFSVELMDLLKASSRRGGFTLAPEAATERMRKIINKPVSTAQLLETSEAIFQHGWHTIKLYFMIGHPSETIEDVQAIADLCKQVLKIGRRVMGHRARVNAGVSTFVPKPHTPFQWVPCDTLDQIEAKQRLLKRELRGPGLKFNWNDPLETMFEAWLSRGDRRMGQVIYHAWRRGAKFDGWGEHFNYQAWMEAFDYVGLDPSFYTHRERPIDETLPWDHIDAALHKRFLTEDYLWSQEGRTRVDCRERCFACGILPKFAELRRQNPGEVWECPEVRSPSRKIKSIPLLPA
ncbi:MAG: TIGR03960 family B12-binding radical SAM protein [Chloroflexi bacterium]|nr:MAG: TIGR03960 family B12-binding radical SAM protein [Chloroflexota bacterium]